MAEGLQSGQALIGAAQVARETEVRQSANGVRFGTYGETGVAPVDLDRIVEAVPKAISAALEANTYYFVPAAMREPKGELFLDEQKAAPVNAGLRCHPRDVTACRVIRYSAPARGTARSPP